MERSIERSLVSITKASRYDLDGHWRVFEPLARQAETRLVEKRAERSPRRFESSLQRSPAHARLPRNALTMRLSLVQMLRQRHPHSVGSRDASRRCCQHRVEFWSEGTGKFRLRAT